MQTTQRKQVWRRTQTAKAARGLAWFSIGLGVAQVLMPRVMSRLSGVPGGEALMRAYGVREIATGVGILWGGHPARWMWGRVAGDALDVATLAAAHLTPGNPLAGRAKGALAAVAAVTVADIATARALQVEQRQLSRPVADYSDRSGLPADAEQMRGAALDDFEAPADMLTPEALRPYPEVRASM
ncbi:hypothetical protein [Caldimonas brevitalea]|uniref:Cyclase/dehydrase n=1 Tax=Caldimonas brevitalea TaxID=413882 RepID=A0A0G3BTQ9_9BURK|nr:hypothetical protein [Caldimonas brevitalea]AKJ31418.1 cyclase/dehydrase [Caldimonas brevitalea]